MLYSAHSNLKQILRGGGVIIPISEVEKLRHREVRSLAQGHRGANCRLKLKPTLVMVRSGGGRPYLLECATLGQLYVI